jgi:hypothetical protein
MHNIVRTAAAAGPATRSCVCCFDGAGKPTGEYEDFMTGFVISDKQVWAGPSPSPRTVRYS